MDAFDTFRAFGDMWGKGSEAFLRAQKEAMESASKGMGGSAAAFGVGSADFASLEDARRSFERSWATATELSSTMTKTGIGLSGGQDNDGKAGEILAKIFDPKGWFQAVGGVDESVQAMMEGPRLADLWNVERKFGAVFSAWLAVRRRSLEHQTLMLDVWTKAAGRFAKILNERSEGGEKLESWRDVMPLWIGTANDLLIDTQRSEAFLASQREMLKASTDLKLAQQDLAAFYSEAFGYPTRAELDDVHLALTELRRELRGLKRTRRKPAGEGARA